MKHTAIAIPLILMTALPCAAAERPNILFIMSDDHAAQAISAYGGLFADVAPTPHLDRLAAEGMRFTNCFCTNSICTPSRSVIMTGKYSHRNGVYQFTPLDQSQPTLAKYLQAHGYQTGFVGKWHLHSNPRGFDWWSVLPGQGRYHNTQFVEMQDAAASGRTRDGKKTPFEGWHSTDIITTKALDWFREIRRDDRPFFFMLHYKAPHDLWENARRYDPYLADTVIPEPENLFDHGAGRSQALDRSQQGIGGPQHHTLFNEEIRRLQGRESRRLAFQVYLKRYFRCVKGIDDNIGQVLKYLDDSGLAKNTIVLYTADQGFFLGEHGLYDKRFMYEEALRMPLLVRWPEKVKPGSINEELVLNLDFPETLLGAAGHTIPADMQGSSFLPLLLGEQVEWRDAFYYRYYLSHFDTPRHYGLRTKTHKLVYFDGMEEWELYDLQSDPAEMKNLAHDPAQTALLTRLQDRLAALQREVQDDPNDVGDHPRTGFESPSPQQ